MNKWSPETLRAILAESTHSAQNEDPGKARTRRRILKAATEQFVHFGYRRASMSDIARRAGVAKGTLYLYFASKNDLMIGAIAQEKLDHLPRILEMLERDGPDQLHAYITMTARMVDFMPLAAAIIRGDHEIAAIFGDMDETLRAEKFRHGEDFTMSLIAEVEPGWSDEEARERAIVVQTLALLTAQVEQETMLRGMSVERFSTLLADIVTTGLRKPESSK